MWPLKLIGEKEVCGAQKKKMERDRLRVINTVETSAACRGNAGKEPLRCQEGGADRRTPAAVMFPSARVDSKKSSVRAEKNSPSLLAMCADVYSNADILRKERLGCNFCSRPDSRRPGF